MSNTKESIHALVKEWSGHKIHPVIKAVEEWGEGAIELSGFLGTGDRDVLRLYSDLDATIYVDIPRDGILHLV